MVPIWGQTVRATDGRQATVTLCPVNGDGKTISLEVCRNRRAE